MGGSILKCISPSVNEQADKLIVVGGEREGEEEEELLARPSEQESQSVSE